MSAVDGIDEFAAQLAGILKEKNAAYGDSFARVPTILAGMYKDVPPEVLEGILFNARVQDKLGRIAKDPLAAGEDAYLDVAGYALLMANVQRLKREAKPKSGKAQREAMRKHAGSMPGLNIDSIDEPDDGEAPAKADGPAVVPASEWIIKRDADFALAHHLPVTTKPKADVPRTGVMFVGDEAVHYDMPAEVPSEPNGRIKRDIWPFVVVHATKTGWYLKHTGWGDKLFNAYDGGCWHPDERDATAFPSEEAAGEYLRKQGELNEAAVKNPLRGDWSSAVATDCGDVWIVRWPAVGLYFQLPRDPSQPAKWIANPHEATKFDTKEAATAWIGAQRAVEASCE